LQFKKYLTCTEGAQVDLWCFLKRWVVMAKGHGMQIETTLELNYSSQSSIYAVHYRFLVNQ